MPYLLGFRTAESSLASSQCLSLYTFILILILILVLVLVLIFVYSVFPSVSITCLLILLNAAPVESLLYNPTTRRIIPIRHQCSAQSGHILSVGSELSQS